MVSEELLVSDLFGLVAAGHSRTIVARVGKDRGKPCGAFATVTVIFLFNWHSKCLTFVVTCCVESQLQYPNQVLLDRTGQTGIAL